MELNVARGQMDTTSGSQDLLKDTAVQAQKPEPY